MTIIAAADLVAALRELHLLESAQLDKVNRALDGRTVDPRALTRELIKHGWLTGYQADLLLQGRGGELVLGEYLLLELLGEGGMGRVFKARHRLMNRTVALKVIRKERLADHSAVERFHREIKLAAQLDHPHLIRAHDAARVGDTHFLVMEYAEGVDLQTLVQQSGPMMVEQASAYIRQAALGLHHALERGLVHRDIKPSNLQITGQGTVLKILDMGLARAHTPEGEASPQAELTQTRMILGTPDYMAPEQIDDPRRADIRADIYSLGCTFYFLLAGRPPFVGCSWEEKLARHRKTEPEPIEQLRPAVPPGLGTILRKMMAKRPEERYATPGEVAHALTPFCPPNGQVMPVTVTWPPDRGQPARATLIGASGAGPTLTGDAPAGPPTAVPVAALPLTPPAGPTVLIPGQPPAAPLGGHPASGSRRGLWLLLGGVNAVVLIVVLAVVLRPEADGEPSRTSSDPGAKLATSPAEQPADRGQVFVDEDFRSTYGKRTVPDGWTGDSFRVVKVDDETCLEVSTVALNPSQVFRETRPPKFITLPPVQLGGDFTIEGVFRTETSPRFGGPRSSAHSLTLRLEQRKSNALLVVAILESGSILIGEEARGAPPNFNKTLPTTFVVTRTGTELTVILNGEIVGSKDLGEAVGFDTLKLGLTESGPAGPRNPLGSCRLYRLKVETNR